MLDRTQFPFMSPTPSTSPVLYCSPRPSRPNRNFRLSLPKFGWLLACVLVFWLVPNKIIAQDGGVEPGAPSSSVSVGIPTRGVLQNGVEVHPNDALQVSRASRGERFGTVEMVNMLGRVAEHVKAILPGSRLLIGDISAPRGGRIRPHRSHRNGRDVDIGFYLLDTDENPAPTEGFVNIERDGCGVDRQQIRYCFDGARNWELLAALVSDPEIRVQYVFIVPYVREMVLRAGEERGASEDVIERVRTVTEPHQGSHAHRNHFHVRVYCDVHDRPRCLDEPPYHTWYEGTPAPLTASAREGIRQRRARSQARRRRINRQRSARRQAERRQRVRRRRAAQQRRANAEARTRRQRRRAAQQRRENAQARARRERR